MPCYLLHNQALPWLLLREGTHHSGTPKGWSYLFKPGHAVTNYGQVHEFANARAN